MLFTTIHVERPEGTVLLRGVPVQIESASGDGERLDFADARPYGAFRLYTTQGAPVNSTEAARRAPRPDQHRPRETNQPAKYRIVAAVETFQNDHQEALCERVIGG